MKRSFLILLSITAIVTITIVACSKSDEQNIPGEKTGIVTPYSPDNDMVELTIKEFLTEFKEFKAGAKEGEDIKLGEAEWTLEASVNYEFRSPKEELGDFYNESQAISVDVYIGEDNEYYISYENAMVFYEEALSFTNQTLDGKGNELLAFDLEVGEVNNSSAELLLGITAASGPLGNPLQINTTDYWYPTQDDNKCDIYVNTGVGDASDRIRAILNAAQSSADYWTNVDTVELIYEPSCPCDYDQCFWEGSDTDCLDPDEMQDWIDKAACIIDETIPAGYSRIYAYDWDVIVSGTIYCHYFKYIIYGIPHTNGGGGSK